MGIEDSRLRGKCSAFDEVNDASLFKGRNDTCASQSVLIYARFLSEAEGRAFKISVSIR